MDPMLNTEEKMGYVIKLISCNFKAESILLNKSYRVLNEIFNSIQLHN